MTRLESIRAMIESSRDRIIAEDRRNPEAYMPKIVWLSPVDTAYVRMEWPSSMVWPTVDGVEIKTHRLVPAGKFILSAGPNVDWNSVLSNR